MTEAEFRAAVARLHADIPKLNDDEIFVRLAQITALVQDGHTGFDLRPLPASENKEAIPIRFDRYEDGIYVRAAAPEYAAAVGGKVIEVGSAGWQEAMRRVDSIESHDPGNDGEQLAWSAKTELDGPRILHGLGLSNSSESAVFVIENDGQRRTVTMKATAPMGEWYLNSVPRGWVDARPKSKPVPVSRQHEDKVFWFTILPDQHAVVRTSGNTGPWDQPGSARTVHLADGNTAREQVTAYEQPVYFAYSTSDYTFVLRYLANSAEGQWWFKKDGSGTQVRWTYTFRAKNWLASIPLALFVQTQWVGYMRTCLRNVERQFRS